MKHAKKLVLVLLLSLPLAGCTLSQKDMAEQTKKNVQEVFAAKPPEPSHKAGKFRFYLPDTYKISSQKATNILLTENSQTYILFINTNEKPKSKVLYNALKSQYKNKALTKTLSDKNRFGFAVADKLKNNRYEITVGIGGVKLTTEADSSKIPDSAKKMMQIAASIKE